MPTSLLYSADFGEVDAFDFAVKVEGVGIGHAGNVVHDGLDFGVDGVVGADLVLFGHDGKEVACIVGSRFQDGVGVFLEDGTEDFEAGNLDLGHDVGVVDALIGELRAGFVGGFVGAFEVLDEAACKFPFHDGFVIPAEDVGTGNGEFVDDAGTEEGDALVFVRDGLEGARKGLECVAFFVFVIETFKDVFRFLVGEDAQLVGVFDVHDLVTDVVSGFYQIHQRMAGVLERLLGQLPDAQFFRHTTVDVFFTLEEAVFEAFGIGFGGFEGVFDDGGEGGVGHGVATGTPAVEIVCQ